MKLLESGAVYRPNWNVHSRIQTLISTRKGGLSQSPYESFNLGVHVGDDLATVFENRKLLSEILPSEPHWLNQVHGTNVVKLSENSNDAVYDADAVYTRSPNQVLAIMTADCLPILFSDQQGSFVAAVHAGWRGLALGVIQSLFKKLVAELNPENENHFMSSITAWIGPAISSRHFEVGQDVMEAFKNNLGNKFPESDFFYPCGVQSKYLADLPAIATWIMKSMGITDIQTDSRCTFAESDDFFSYRREGVTGRMASLIWLNP